jgi:hypothetical protein
LKHLREMASDIAVKTTVTIGGQNNFAHRRLNEEVMILLYLILLPIVYCITLNFIYGTPMLCAFPIY